MSIMVTQFTDTCSIAKEEINAEPFSNPRIKYYPMNTGATAMDK